MKYDTATVRAYSDDLLLFLNEHGPSLQYQIIGTIVPSNMTLEKIRMYSEERGLITVTETRMGTKKYTYSLTDKGRQVAEQLKNAELASQGRLVKSFFSKPQQVLIFLGRVGRATVPQLKEEIPGSYEDLEELKKMNLITSDIDNVAYPPVNYIMLTEKGKKVCEEANKIAELVKK